MQVQSTTDSRMNTNSEETANSSGYIRNSQDGYPQLHQEQVTTVQQEQAQSRYWSLQPMSPWPLQITHVLTMPESRQQLHQQQELHMTTSNNNAVSIAGASDDYATVATSERQTSDSDSKERCRMCLTNLMELSKRKTMSPFSKQRSTPLFSSMYVDNSIIDPTNVSDVNLSKKSQSICDVDEHFGTQIRPWQDKNFLHLPTLQARIREMVAKHNLEESSEDVAVLISQACEKRLKNIIEQLALLAELRENDIQLNPEYEIDKNVRDQIQFLEEVNKAKPKKNTKKRRRDLGNFENPEQKMEELKADNSSKISQLKKINKTIKRAIGPRKKLKLERKANNTDVNSSTGNEIKTDQIPPIPSVKQLNICHMICFMEQDRKMRRSKMLYKAYLK